MRAQTSFRTALSMAALVTLATAGAARAENASAVQTIVIETGFTLCTIGAESRNCSQETWSITILPDGWKLGAVTQFDSQEDQWSEQCQNGSYQSTAAGGGWVGQCRVHGDANMLCFDADVTQGPNAGVKAVSEQCFTIRDTGCAMTMSGVSHFPDENGEILRFDIAAQDVTFCTVSQ